MDSFKTYNLKSLFKKDKLIKWNKNNSGFSYYFSNSKNKNLEYTFIILGHLFLVRTILKITKFVSVFCVKNCHQRKKKFLGRLEKGTQSCFFALARWQSQIFYIWLLLHIATHNAKDMRLNCKFKIKVKCHSVKVKHFTCKMFIFPLHKV